jgi:hypothetical protein
MLIWASFSAIVCPGTGGRPLITKRVPSPAVCESIVVVFLRILPQLFRFQAIHSYLSTKRLEASFNPLQNHFGFALSFHGLPLPPIFLRCYPSKRRERQVRAKDQRIFVSRPFEQLPPGADHLVRRSCSVPGTKQFRVGDVEQMVDSIANVEQRFAC